MYLPFLRIIDQFPLFRGGSRWDDLCIYWEWMKERVAEKVIWRFAHLDDVGDDELNEGNAGG